MRNLIKLTFLISVFCSCNPDKNKLVNPESVRFATTESSELFFKNVRQTYYDKVDDQQTKLEQYRIARRPLEESVPTVSLCIVNNWRYDEAYILVEPNTILEQQSTLTIQWADSLKNEAGKYSFTFGNKDTHFTFASQLYNSIIAKHQLSINVAGTSYPFLHRRDAREAFRISMVDYYRLVGIY